MPSSYMQESFNGHDVLQLYGTRTALAALTVDGEAWVWSSMMLDGTLPYAPRRPTPLRALQVR